MQDGQLRAIEDKCEREIDEAWAFAEAAPYSEPEVAMEDIYWSGTEA